MSNNIEKETTFPTGKPHISFSEVRIWKECSWKHKLTYVDKLSEFEVGIYTEYGSILHESIENYLNTRVMDIEGAKKKLDESWQKHGFDKVEMIEERQLISESQGWKYRHNYIKDWKQWCENSLSDLPAYLDEGFPEWEVVSAEETLYEKIPNNELSFKGFIDCVLKFKKNGKDKYAIIDWKTAGARGWDRRKSTDIKTTAQLTLYKHYWSTKHNVPLKDIECHFVLLKRGTKKGKVCKTVSVSAGPKSIEKANKLVNDMLAGVSNRFFLKNRTACKFCPFKDTESCK